VQAECGLPLLSADGLAKAGVDTARGWTVFERGEASFLEVSVVDRARLVQALEAWALAGGLRLRGARGRAVLFSRTKGSRPASGYLVAGDRAVVLLRPAGRRSGLEQALQSVEAGLPLQAPVDGPLLQWRDDAPFARDLWIAWSFSSRGIAWRGSARALVPGWFEPGGDDGWAAALTGDVEGEHPLRMRARLGEKGAGWLGPWMARVSGADDGRTAPALARLARGRVELDAGGLSPRAAPAASADVEPLVGMFSPVLLVRPPESTPSRVGSLVARRDGEWLAVGADLSRLSHVRSRGPAAFVCPSGRALFAVRLDGPSLARALDGVSLWGALRDDGLRGLFAAQAGFGPLLTRTGSARLLACAAGKGATFEGSWSLR